jgi:sulfur-carrier protein
MSTVRLRYWAALRDAAGATSADVSADTLAEALESARSSHPTGRFGEILDACSVMVDEQPVHGADPAGVTLRDGAVVDLLPPFAGG